MYRLITTDSCSKCKVVKNKLQKLNIEFEEIDAYTAEGTELCKKLNIMSAGVLIDSNNNIIDINKL